MAFYHTIGNKELGFRNDLGITRELKKVFKRDYHVLVEQVSTLSQDDMYKFIYTCLSDQDEFGKLSDFIDWIESPQSGAGAMDIYDAIEALNMEIQYPGKSQEEVDEIVKKKMARHQELSNI